MLCAVIGEKVIDGKKCVWIFRALNKTQGRQIANTILFFERIGIGEEIVQFSPAGGHWKAVAVYLTMDEIRSLIEKTEKNKIVEIKRKRPPPIDAIYLTRLQKER